MTVQNQKVHYSIEIHFKCVDIDDETNSYINEEFDEISNIGKQLANAPEVIEDLKNRIITIRKINQNEQDKIVNRLAKEKLLGKQSNLDKDTSQVFSALVHIREVNKTILLERHKRKDKAFQEARAKALDVLDQMIKRAPINSSSGNLNVAITVIGLSIIRDLIASEPPHDKKE